MILHLWTNFCPFHRLTLTWKRFTGLPLLVKQQKTTRAWTIDLTTYPARFQTKGLASTDLLPIQAMTAMLATSNRKMTCKTRRVTIRKIIDPLQGQQKSRHSRIVASVSAVAKMPTPRTPCVPISLQHVTNVEQPATFHLFVPENNSASSLHSSSSPQLTSRDVQAVKHSQTTYTSIKLRPSHDCVHFFWQ